ncbi:hypothetical protein JCM8097_000113 [Rhodosporidiobolus ruineniae]
MFAPKPSNAVKTSSTSPPNGTVDEERWPVASGANPGSALRSLAALSDGRIAVAAGPPSPDSQSLGSQDPAVEPDEPAHEQHSSDPTESGKGNSPHEDPFSPVTSGSSSAILSPALGFDGLVAFAALGGMMGNPAKGEEDNLGATAGEGESAAEQATHHPDGSSGGTGPA